VDGFSWGGQLGQEGLGFLEHQGAAHRGLGREDGAGFLGMLSESAERGPGDGAKIHNSPAQDPNEFPLPFFGFFFGGFLRRTLAPKRKDVSNVGRLAIGFTVLVLCWVHVMFPLVLLFFVQLVTDPAQLISVDPNKPVGDWICAFPALEILLIAR
jgi:hypothetical protein